MRTPTDALLDEIKYFISMDGYQQHDYLGAFTASSKNAFIFWMYLRTETLNRRIVQDGWS